MVPSSQRNASVASTVVCSSSRAIDVPTTTLPSRETYDAKESSPSNDVSS
jgi:hypothetical protein